MPLPQSQGDRLAHEGTSRPSSSASLGKEPAFTSSPQRRASASALASKYDEFRKHLSPERLESVWEYVDELKQQVDQLESRVCKDDLVIHSEFTTKFKTPVKRKPNLSMGMTQQAELVAEYAAFYDPKGAIALERLRTANEEVKSMPNPWAEVQFEADRPRRIHDEGDGVERCGFCAWELIDGECQNCGRVYSDSDGEGDREHQRPFVPQSRQLYGVLPAFPLPPPLPINDNAIYHRHNHHHYLHHLLDDEAEHSDLESDDGDWVDEEEALRLDVDVDHDDFIDDQYIENPFEEAHYQGNSDHELEMFSPTQEDEYEQDHDPDEILARAVVDGYNRTPNGDSGSENHKGEIVSEEDEDDGAYVSSLDLVRYGSEVDFENGSDEDHDDDDFDENEGEDDHDDDRRRHRRVPSCHRPRSRSGSLITGNGSISRGGQTGYAGFTRPPPLQHHYQTNQPAISRSDGTNRHSSRPDNALVVDSVDGWSRRFRETRRQQRSNPDARRVIHALSESSWSNYRDGPSSSNLASSPSPVTVDINSAKRGVRRYRSISNSNSYGSGNSNDNSESETENGSSRNNVGEVENEGSSSADDIIVRRYGRHGNKGKGNAMKPPRRRRRLLDDDDDDDEGGIAGGDNYRATCG
ncbi:hypothetical protein SeMB42_g06529 [Synchytrium endobioticum]|uniref:Uncharacterized protein n=1 Tax=Synchytrium endobioticum TaxID=286115 RepID=A0A507CBP7_9FUNG|nr:hypothetical protein SeMB42_g06529 [Synchytrium endobioticum]